MQGSESGARWVFSSENCVYYIWWDIWWYIKIHRMERKPNRSRQQNADPIRKRRNPDVTRTCTYNTCTPVEEGTRREPRSADGRTRTAPASPYSRRGSRCWLPTANRTRVIIWVRVQWPLLIPNPENGMSSDGLNLESFLLSDQRGPAGAPAVASGVTGLPRSSNVLNEDYEYAGADSQADNRLTRVRRFLHLSTAFRCKRAV